MEYIYIKKIGARTVDIFHSKEFDYKFVRTLLDKDTNSIVEVYIRRVDNPMSHLFTCTLD